MLFPALLHKVDLNVTWKNLHWGTQCLTIAGILPCILLIPGLFFIP